MKALGVLIGLGIGLVAYLFGGLVGMTITAWALMPFIALWIAVEFRRFQRDQAKAIAQRLSVS